MPEYAPEMAAPHPGGPTHPAIPAGRHGRTELKPSRRVTIDVGSRRRTYLHVAPRSLDPDAPLLVALHGSSQNGATMRKFGGATLDALAENIGADLVYLNGYRRAWNDARIVKRSAAQKTNRDDVAFISAVIAEFARPAILIGYSNGGQMVHRFIRETRGQLAGVVTIAAGLPVPADFTLNDAAADDVPVLLLHGTGDSIMPANGGPTKLLGRTHGSVRSAYDTAASYAGSAEPCIVSAEGTTRYDWDRVRLIAQTGAGHVIPNRITAQSRWLVGVSHHDIDTGDEIQAFFDL